MFPGGATPGKMIMGLKVVKCTHILPLGLNRVQVTPASDLGLGWALVRSVLKNFSLGNMITRRLFPANNSFCLSIFLSRLFLLNVPAIFPNLILYHVQVSNRKRFIFYLFWQTSYFQVNCCGKQLQVPEKHKIELILA